MAAWQEVIVNSVTETGVIMIRERGGRDILSNYQFFRYL
jgi:hypothetical protein